MVITARSAPVRRASEGAPPSGPTGADVDPLRPARIVAHGGYTVLVCRADGSIDGIDTGLYDLDTRILSRYVLRLDGAQPSSIGSCVAMADEWASTLHIRRTGGSPEGPALPQDAWAIHVTRRIGCGMAETITIRNESMEPASARLTIDLDADFRDVLRAPVGSPEPHIEVQRLAETGRLEWVARYRHAGRQDQRGLAVSVDPPPADLEQRDDGGPHGRRLAFDIDLEAHGESTIRLTFASLADGAWRQPSDASHRPAMAERWRTVRTRVSTPEALVGPAVERAADDLLALRAWELEPSDDGSAWVVNAGVPSFTGFFGRDAITAGWQAAMLGPEPLRGALEVAARTQGRRSDAWTEEEPGRMVHEMRRGPLSMLGVRPHRAYYGSQTTGSMFVLGLSELWHWTGDDEILRRHRDAAMRTIEWAESFGDRDKDGFLEYRRQSPEGLKNQGWKDSDEAIRYPDGRIVENPISTVEEQAFHYMALQRMAEILVALDEPGDRADELLRRAATLREAWHDAFWMPDHGFYALALDPDGRPVETIASNVGHALGVGIIPREQASAVADRLLADDLFSGWGIRTLSNQHPSFNPFAYHLGAVWPVENATIALGLKRYGLDEHVDQLLDGMFAAIAHCRGLRLPEALTGHDRRVLSAPLPYPGSQSPQAWSASATVQFLQVTLGLYPFAPAGVLGLVRPRLPAWLPNVTLRGLRIGPATVTLRFERDTDGSARHTVVDQVGELHVLEVPPPNAVAGDDGVMPRLLAWALEHAPGRTAGALRIAMGDPGAIADRGPSGRSRHMSVVVITGAGAGVGRATARAFAERGYDVGLIARDATRLAAAADEVEALGRRALVLPLDVADADAVEAAADRVETEMGQIDVWVNGAMTSALGPIDQLTSEEVRRVTDVTYLGTVYGTQAALRRMRLRDRGVIVQIGSGLAYRSVPLQSAYCGAKSAARGFTDSLRCELLHDGSNVRVTMVHLPAVNTPQFSWVRSRLPRAMQPLPPVYQPELAAEAIVWVAEHPRRELLVGWPTVLGVLGQRLAPGLMDRYLANRAWEGQMSDDPARPGQPDNLQKPVAADVGAHGAFDDMASEVSPLLWADMHREIVAGAAVGIAALFVGAARLLRR